MQEESEVKFLSSIIAIIMGMLLLALPTQSRAEVWLSDSETGCKIWIGSLEQGMSVKWDGACQNNKATGEGNLHFFLNGELCSHMWGCTISEGKLINRINATVYQTLPACEGRDEASKPGYDRFAGKYSDQQGTSVNSVAKQQTKNTDLGSTGSWISAANGCKAPNPNPQPNETIEWSGNCVNGIIEGNGVLKRLINGTVTTSNECSFVQGYCSGKGIRSWPDGSKYVGDFVSDERTGKGILTLPNGSKYEGDFLKGEWKGRGVFISVDGDRNEGEWKNYKQNGYGVYVYADGRRYAGEFKNGVKTRGVMTFVNGSRYDGEFSNDKMNGRGVFKSVSGDRYEGEYKDGKWNGRGVYTYADGSRYEGEFKDNGFSGKGVYKDVNGDRYEGEFKDDKRNGRGIYTYANGSRYDGEFRDGKFNGRGIFKSVSGNRYEGEFRDGKFNGRGIYTYADGTSCNDIWKDDKSPLCAQKREFELARSSADFDSFISKYQYNDPAKLVSKAKKKRNESLKKEQQAREEQAIAERQREIKRQEEARLAELKRQEKRQAELNACNRLYTGKTVRFSHSGDCESNMWGMKFCTVWPDSYAGIIVGKGDGMVSIKFDPKTSVRELFVERSCVDVW